MPVRTAVCWFSFALAFLSATVNAAAHPLGNFTINHLAKVTPQRSALYVRYVLDIAEIPTFQIMHAGATSDVWSQQQLDEWGDREVAVVLDGFHITVDGSPLRLVATVHHERLRPGAGGLPILYWTCDLSAPINPGMHRISIDDSVYAERRIGWKDIIVSPPQSEPTHELLHYPNALIGSPRRVSALTFDLTASGQARTIVVQTGDPVALNASNSIVRSNALTDMFTSNNRTPLFIFLTILVAFALGALHAIEPGHGKALLAFTLVGSRATVKQAMILAASLTFAHTIGVIILGAVLLSAASFISESIYPWITFGSGVAVAVIGARNLAQYMHARDGHEHGHDHHHDVPIHFRGAVVAAMSGGVAPCPAAIVVMLAALRLHQLGYGLLLIVIFSLGLASVLTGLGIAVVHGSALVQRSGKFDRIVAAGPLISATLISLVGAVMIGQGLVAQGVSAPVWLLAGFVVLAIAGYGIAPQHQHHHHHRGQPAEEHAR